MSSDHISDVAQKVLDARLQSTCSMRCTNSLLAQVQDLDILLMGVKTDGKRKAPISKLDLC